MRRAIRRRTPKTAVVPTPVTADTTIERGVRFGGERSEPWLRRAVRSEAGVDHPRALPSANEETSNVEPTSGLGGLCVLGCGRGWVLWAGRCLLGVVGAGLAMVGLLAPCGSRLGLEALPAVV